MFISDSNIDNSTNQIKCKIMKAIITKKLAYVPNLSYEQIAKLNGCKKEDIQRFVSGL